MQMKAIPDCADCRTDCTGYEATIRYEEEKHMTTQMIIALAITALMVVLIMMDKLPFGAPPLLACLLLVIFGIADIKAAFGGFSNATIVMLAEFMAIIAALQKTSFIANFKKTMFQIANQGGIKAYMLMILIVMLGCSLFGTGSTAYYVMVIGFLSTLPEEFNAIFREYDHKEASAVQGCYDSRLRCEPSVNSVQHSAAVRYRNRSIKQRRRCSEHPGFQVCHCKPVPVLRLPA